jgi:uncharacterized protein YjbJ (UPF0337 family)
VRRDTLLWKTEEVVGHVTGNKKLEADGKIDQLKGAIHNALGDAKYAGKKTIGSIKKAASKH